MTTELTLDAAPTAVALPGLVEGLPTAVLDEFLGRQRWYGEAARPLASHRIVDSAPIEGAVASLALVSLAFEDGGAEVYALLLGTRDGEPDDAVLATVTTGEAAPVHVYEAGGDDAVCLALFNAVVRGSDFEGEHGTFLINDEGTQALDAGDEIRRLDSEHSNTAFIVDGRYFVKILRRLANGRNPEIELNRFLRARSEFRDVPAFLKSLEYTSKEDSHVVLMVQKFVESHGSTWNRAVAAARAYLDEQETEQVFEDEARQIGDLLGNLHLALASNKNDAEFAPEPIGSDDWSRWRTSVINQVDRVAKSYDGGEGVLGPVWVEIAESLRAIGTAVQRGGMKLRPHGDFHLNQLLRTEDGWAVLDFEGEPNRSLDERLAKESPLRDAAMMLRSLHYAAYAALVEHAGPADASHWPRWHERAEAWYVRMREAFLDAYYEKTAGEDLLPPLEEDRDALLRLFELDRVLVDLDYNLNSRPDWVAVDLNVINKLLG